MEEVISDHVLRSRLVEGGRERARIFTWEKAAARVMDIYKRVMEEV